MKNSRSLFDCVFLFCFAAFAFGQTPSEWPILNNINHTGFSATMVLRPPLKVKWAVSVPGSFKAGPVIAESCLVAQSRDGYLFCYNANTGEIKWRYFVQRMAAHSVGMTETGPCIWNGRVYASFYSAGHPGITGMRCFDLQTGRVLWKKDVGYTNHRIHYSPQVRQGKLFFCSNRETTGKKTETLSELIHVAQVQAWDAMTGDTLWVHNMSTKACNNTTLLVVGDTVFASVGDGQDGTPGDSGRTVALDLNGGLLWENDSMHVWWKAGNLQYYQGSLMVLSLGGMRLLNASDGSPVLSGGGDPYSKIFPIMNGKYYSRSYGGFAVPYFLSTGAAAPFASMYNKGASSGCSAPTAANGYVYNAFGSPNINFTVDAGRQIVAVDEAGNLAWSFHDCANHCASMSIAYDRLYLAGGTEGLIYCFENAQ
ncbi:MAG: hypothetical protein A2293_17230 [Elusimicrobia bacterium RIFOXYB2_FULL_49_7]|nr:MAG: hypothetical protein A2293_17230 [Elusimicrobia bacterium RIFOXYB2_FULL_49_7]